MKNEEIEIGTFTEEQIDAIYFFINNNMESMEDEEKRMWIDILKKIDAEYE